MYSTGLAYISSVLLPNNQNRAMNWNFFHTFQKSLKNVKINVYMTYAVISKIYKLSLQSSNERVGH